MATSQYLQVGTDECFYFVDFDNYALIVNEYGADVLARIKAGSCDIYINKDYCYYSNSGLMISDDGSVYIPINKSTTPTTPSYLLLEDGSYILLESGDKILLQRQ